MTISEIAATGLPSILIPYPYAIDDHQTANASYLADAGAGVLLPQQQLTAGLLAETINSVKGKLEQMSLAAQQCARLDATEKVAQICINEAKK
jgi:UDP-N-acetylglucosamine--N-acetylmuramyl-(pentapeptide) pyrophosphoryl-undecaprenol N-acetylglucosamine transferase